MGRQRWTALLARDAEAFVPMAGVQTLNSFLQQLDTTAPKEERAKEVDGTGVKMVRLLLPYFQVLWRVWRL